MLGPNNICAKIILLCMKKLQYVENKTMNKYSVLRIEGLKAGKGSRDFARTMTRKIVQIASLLHHCGNWMAQIFVRNSSDLLAK